MGGDRTVRFDSSQEVKIHDSLNNPHFLKHVNNKKECTRRPVPRETVDTRTLSLLQLWLFPVSPIAAAAFSPGTRRGPFKRERTRREGGYAPFSGKAATVVQNRKNRDGRGRGVPFNYEVNKRRKHNNGRWRVEVGRRVRRR